MPVDQLTWEYLTGAVNEMKSPATFLTDFLYPNRETFHLETIELSLLERGRKTAPFVKRGGEGVMVGGYAETFMSVTTPHMRVKRPISPMDLLYNRRVATPIFPSKEEQGSAIDRHMVRELQVLVDDVTNSTEWLVAQALTGTISYQVEDQDAFRVTYPRAATHDIALATDRAWDNTDLTKPRPLQDILMVKEVMSEESGLQPTDAIVGKNVAYAIAEMAEGGASSFKNAFTRDSNIIAGALDLARNFATSGAILLGEMGGVRFWWYNRTVEHNGTSTPLIRDDYIEFVNSDSGASQRVMYFGAIPDMAAINTGAFEAERFAKAWETHDPSGMTALLASRPLPVPRRPSATFSLKATGIA